MAVELMTSAVCWDMDANVSAAFAHTAKELFYFCPCCLREVAASVSTLGNFFFLALNSHQRGCANEKAKPQDSGVTGVQKSGPAASPQALIPTHLGKLGKRRKSAKPSTAEMQALVARVEDARPMHPGTLAEVVDAWSSMTTSERHQTPLSIAGQQLSYFDAFAQLSPTQKDTTLLECDRVITFAPATVSVLSHVVLVVTWLKFETQNKPVPIRAKMKSTDPAAAQLTNGQKVKLFLHGPAPTLNAQQTYYEMSLATAYSGSVVTA
ncbi:hypothetical protein V6L78_18900 [Pseudomonas canadensis]|uniref:hypothetical protein n=1 Tax=Pseudomonas canadensis TaxID=915099 RepID=UPI0030D48062